MKKITVAVCVDDNLGMTFLGRRVSKDRVLVSEFMDTAKENRVFINSFSKKIFEAYEKAEIVDSPLEAADDGSYCFIENLPLKSHLDLISTLIIYRWNRIYPYDMKLDVDPEKEGFRLFETKDFAGSSHNKITKEVWVR